VNASSTIDQDMLKDITLPELSSSQRIPGPIRAIVMDTDTQYDLIIGMDIMQVIRHGTIIECLFKPHDYFDDDCMGYPHYCYRVPPVTVTGYPVTVTGYHLLWLQGTTCYSYGVPPVRFTGYYLLQHHYAGSN
jgi:hypothetical protein